MCLSPSQWRSPRKRALTFPLINPFRSTHMQGQRGPMWAPATLPPGLGASEQVIQTPQPATEDQGGPHGREERWRGGWCRITWMSHTHTLKHKHAALKPVRTLAKSVYFNYGDAWPWKSRTACMYAPHGEIILQTHGSPQPGSFLNNGLKGSEKDRGLCRGKRLSSKPLRGTSWYHAR